MKLKLEIESIPVSSWGISLANLLGQKEWTEIRQQVYRDSDYQCYICGVDGVQLNCHETWKFSYKTKIQSLVDFQCLCKLCHDCKHFGRSKSVYDKAYVQKLVEHWCKVNKRTVEQFREYEVEVFEINKKRANIFWQVKVGRRILY
jgi:hypothetical protein